MRLVEALFDKSINGVLKKPAEHGIKELTTGFGIDSRVPARVVAYIVPLLALACKLGESKIPVEAQWYIASRFLIQMNNFPEQLIGEQTKLLKAYIDEFRKVAFPDIKLTYLQEENPFEEKRFHLIQEFAEILQKNATNRMKNFAGARMGIDSWRYIAAHGLYMWDPYPPLDVDNSMYLTERKSPPEDLVIIGGPAEELFYECRQILLQELGGNPPWDTQQLISRVGRRPPYIMTENDTSVLNTPRLTLEMLFGQENNGYAITDPDVRRDFLYLLVSLNPNLCYSMVKNELKNIRPMHPRIADELTVSLGILNEIITQLQS